MRLTRLFAAVISIVVVWLPVLAASPASATDIPVDTKTTVSAASSNLVYQDALILAGDVEFTDGTSGNTYSVGDATVTLERKWRGSTEWKQIGTTTTAATTTAAGTVYTYSFTQTATRNAAYRVSYAGDQQISLDGVDTYTLSASRDSVTVWVSRKLVANDVQPQPHHYYVKGSATPYSGKVVSFQRKTCKACAWKIYNKVRTTSAGGYRFPVDFPTKSGTSWWYRVEVPGNTSYVTTHSQLFRAYVL